MVECGNLFESFEEAELLDLLGNGETTRGNILLIDFSCGSCLLVGLSTIVVIGVPVYVVDLGIWVG